MKGGGGNLAACLTYGLCVRRKLVQKVGFVRSTSLFLPLLPLSAVYYVSAVVCEANGSVVYVEGAAFSVFFCFVCSVVVGPLAAYAVGVHVGLRHPNAAAVREDVVTQTSAGVD